MNLRFGVLWCKIELRRRWGTLVLLALIVAVSAGMLLAAVSGARRGASAADRLLAQTLPATAVVHTNQVQVDYWPRVRALPGVAAVSTFPGYSGFGVDEAPADTVGVYLPLDAAAMRSIERPVILSGRLPDPARADEAVVTQRFVQTTGRGVGDRVTVRLFTPEQIDTGQSAVRTTVIPHPDGPAVRTTIVGVVRSAWFSDQIGGRGQLIPSPGLAAAYGHNVLGAELDGEQWALVRLSDGDAGLPRFRKQLSSLVTSTPGADIVPRTDTVQQLRRVARFEAACLLGLAAAVLIAAAFLIATSVSRQVAATRADLATAAAFGVTPGQAIALSAVGPAIAGLCGSVLGAGLAIGASRWLPLGVAATLEPAPGIQIDVPVIGAGVVLVMVAVGAWALLVSAFMTQRPQLAPRASQVAQAAAGSGLPVPVVMGLRHALEGGGGRAAIPVRSALAGAVVGVLGVVGALVFAAAVSDAAQRPQRFGQLHQLVVAFGYNGTDLSCTAAAMRIISGDPSVRSLVDLRFQTAQLTSDSGPGDAPGTGRTITVFSADRPGAAAVMLEGRVATAPDDVVLAPTTARRLGAAVGSRVPLVGQLPGAGYGATGDVPAQDPCGGSTRPSSAEPPASAGQKRRVVLTVRGIGFVPQTEYNEYDSGAWVSAPTYGHLFGTGFVNHEALVGLVTGANPRVVASRLVRAFAPIPGSEAMFTSEPLVIRRGAEIGDLRVLPLAFCVFLAGLGLAAIGHVLIVSARRRQGDLAVLRALGMTPAQARWVPSTQAMVYALTGLVAGVPLGVAAGRVVWRVISDGTPLAYHPPGIAWAGAVVAVAALLAVQLLAIPAARRAAGAPIAESLRAE